MVLQDKWPYFDDAKLCSYGVDQFLLQVPYPILLLVLQHSETRLADTGYTCNKKTYLREFLLIDQVMLMLINSLRTLSVLRLGILTRL